MAWMKKANVAQYKGADWSNFVQKESNCTPEKARRIALVNPDITFYFFCREGMVLEGHVYEKYGAFAPGDAVFFSGEPWYGSAPQCDAYEKEGMNIAYVSPKDTAQFLEAGDYQMADGSTSLDVACIFAGNLVLNERPYLKAENNPDSKEPFNPNIMEILGNGSVQKLQDKGITVLLTIMGGHHAGGWSNFETEAAAADFANYLKTEVVDKYGLDGIDIDDEYSDPDLQIPNSLVTVTGIMREIMPNKIVSKALYADSQYFSATYNGKTLADTLTYGWEMTYWGQPQNRLPQYVGYGMNKNKLSLGFSADQFSGSPVTVVDWLKTNGYEGVMIFNFFNPDDTSLMGNLVNAWYGPGNWNYVPSAVTSNA